jgi:hypothetical protein
MIALKNANADCDQRIDSHRVFRQENGVYQPPAVVNSRVQSSEETSSKPPSYVSKDGASGVNGCSGANH